MKFSLDKYNYIVSDNKVIALSTYAGHTVRGIAKCDPKDEFNLENGKKLAAARCNYRVALKRAERSMRKVNEAANAVNAASLHYSKMVSYNHDAMAELEDAKASLDKLLSSM